MNTSTHEVGLILGSFDDPLNFSFIILICSWVGVPKIFIISKSCSVADLPGKIGLFMINSAMTHPMDQTSTWVVYFVAPTTSSGGR